MQGTELKQAFREGVSIFNVFVSLFSYCKSHQRRLHRLRQNGDSRLREFFDEIYFWIKDLDSKEYLQNQHLETIFEQMDLRIKDVEDALVFADCFVRAVDTIYAHLADQFDSNIRTRRISSIYEQGYLVKKHSDYAKLLTKQVGSTNQKFRMRKDLWPQNFASQLLNFHVFSLNWGEDGINIFHIPEVMDKKLRQSNNLTVGISQIAIEPEFRIGGNSPNGIKFQIKYSKDDDALYNKICTEIECAFQEKASILVFPELILPPKREKDLLAFLSNMVYKHRHFLMVIIGYLHNEVDGQKCINLSACMVPELERSTQEYNYKVLCNEIKKQPVNFLKEEKGVDVISEKAYLEGAIEDIDPGENWTIIESTIGRIGMVICKDFLEIKEQFLEELEIDLLIVSAMTPSMIGKFKEKSDYLANFLVSVIIANNGWFVEASGNKNNNYSYAATPILIDKQPYRRPFNRQPKQTKTLELFSF